MLLRAPEIGIHEERAPPQLGQGYREIRRYAALALAGRGARYEYGPGALVRRRKDQAGTHGPDGLGEACGNSLVQQQEFRGFVVKNLAHAGGGFHLGIGNEAQVRRIEVRLYFVRGGEGVVHVLQHENESDRQQAAAQQSHQHNEPAVRPGWSDRGFRLVKEADVAGLQFGGEAGLRGPQQQRLVELAGALGLPPHHAILDTGAVEGQRLQRPPVEFREQLLLPRGSHLKLDPQRIHHRQDLVPQPVFRIADRRFEVDHFRVARAQLFGQTGFFAAQTRQGELLLLNDLVPQDFGKASLRIGIAPRRLQVQVARFAREPRHRRFGRRRVQVLQLPDDDGLPILDGRRAVLLPVALEQPLARFQRLPLFRHSLLQPTRRVPGGGEAEFHVPLDMKLRQRIDDGRRQLRLERTEPQRDDAAVTLGPDDLKLGQQARYRSRFRPAFGIRDAFRRRGVRGRTSSAATTARDGSHGSG